MFSKRLYLLSLLGLTYFVVFAISSFPSIYYPDASNEFSYIIVDEDFIYDWTGYENSFTLNLSNTFMPGFYFLNLVWKSSGDKTNDLGYNFMVNSDKEFLVQGRLKQGLQDDKKHLTPLAFEITESTDNLSIAISWSASYYFRAGQLTISAESEIKRVDLEAAPIVYSPSLSTLSFSSTFAYGEMAAIVSSEAEKVQQVIVHTELDLSRASSFNWVRVEILTEGQILLDEELRDGGGADLVFTLVPPESQTCLEIKLTAMGSGIVEFKIMNIELSNPSDDAFEDDFPGMEIIDIKFSIEGKEIILGPVGQLLFFVGGFFLNLFLFRNIFLYKVINPPREVYLGDKTFLLWVAFWYYESYIIIDFFSLNKTGVRIVTLSFVLAMMVLHYLSLERTERVEKFVFLKNKEAMKPFDVIYEDSLPQPKFKLDLRYKSETLATEKGSNAFIQPVVSFTLEKEKKLSLKDWKREEALLIYEKITNFAEIKFSLTEEKTQVLLLFEPIDCERDPEKIKKMEEKIKDEGVGVAILLKNYVPVLLPLALAVETNKKLTSQTKNRKRTFKTEQGGLFEMLEKGYRSTGGGKK